MSPGRDRGNHRTSFQPGYHIRDRDLKKIHKAASVGNVAKVQPVLLLRKNGLNDKDKKNRTALHLACANGHSEVVALLLERKCQLNLGDSENKTALIKAIECQEEECATLLLEHGADPNVTDVNGNTALHYAVFCQNVSLAAKLLSYDANIEAKNEDDLTPLLLGISERKQQMVEFLVKKEADIHAVDKMQRTALILAVNYECTDVVSLLLQRGADVFSPDVFGWTAEEYAAISGFDIICELISEYKEKRPKTTPQKSNPAAKSSAEDSLSRFSSKPGVDSRPTSDDDVLGSETKKEPKPKLAKLMKAFQLSKRNQAECGIVRRENTTLSENNNSDSEIEDVAETLPKPSPGVQGFSHPAFPRPDPLPKPLKTLAGLGLAKVEEEKKHKDAADESRLIQQRKSGGNNKQAFPAMENKGSHSSDPGVHRKGVKKKNDNKWTPEERVIAPIFEKTDSLTGGLLHVNDDSILREVDQDDGRPARKTAYEKKKVSDSGRKARGLLSENHMQDAIAMARVGIDTVNNQNQEKEKKCFEGIEIVEGENDYPQEAIKLNKETLTKAIFQHTGQLNVPVAENTMLNPELENAKRSKQRLETEVESYRFRLAPAIHDHDQGQTSQRDLELASQKAKDKRLRLQEQMKIDMANLKSDNEMLSQELSKVKNKFNQLKIKLHQTTDDLREKTLMLERVQRDLRQAQCQKQVIEHMFNEQRKVNEYLGKQESLRERLSQLQSENMLLRQQLDDAQNRADSKEKIVISIRDQFLQTLRKLQAEREEQRLMLEERNTELIMLWKHVEDRMRQYENEKAEGEAVVRHLQQELSDSFKKRSELAESLDVMSYHCAKLEVEAQDLKSNLHQLTSQLQETQDQHTEAVRCAEKTQDHIQKLEMENTKLQTTVKKQADRIKQLQENLLSIRSIDDLPPKLETVCSTCLHVNAKIEVLQEELLSMKGMQKRCEKLEKNKKKLQQEVVTLKSHIELNMIEHSQVEHYKQEVEERVRQDLIEKLREVNMFLQIQAASQENLEKLRENDTAFIISQMELRIKELESELSKTKTSQAELEKYKKLYLEELKVRKSLESKLDTCSRSWQEYN